MASPPSSSKIHASPSKGASSSAALTSANRTYDAKLVQREMLRLGTLAGQLPAAALSTIAGTTAAALTSASTLVMPSANAGATGPAGSTHGHHTLSHALGHGHGGNTSLGMGAVGNDGGAWAQLHVHVLPLFNHEQLHLPIEDLNSLVRRHIEAVMSAGPSRALSTLEVDVAELIAAGMTTLNTKLSGVEDDKLPARVVELWTFFWDQVLPYVEGVFIPLQTDTLLLALHRTPKPNRQASPTTLVSPDSDPPNGAGVLSPIDVRTIALRAFRDKIIVPVASRLEARLLSMRPGASFSSSLSVPGLGNVIAEASAYQHPRLQQMLLVLHSQAQRARPALSLTAPAPSLSPQELAIRKLLDALAEYRAAPVASSSGSASGSGAGSTYSGNARTGLPLNPQRHRRAPSFLSGGAPRDRRGRIGIGINAGVDSDKENAKRRGRYIDDSMYPAPLGSNSGPGPGPVSVAGHGHTASASSYGTQAESGPEGLNGDSKRNRMRRYFPSEWDEEGEWEVAYGRAARTGDGQPASGLAAGVGNGSWDGESTSGGGGMTPRGVSNVGGGAGAREGEGRFTAERERERTFLESLRSPNPIDGDDTGEQGFRTPYSFGQSEGHTNGNGSRNAMADNTNGNANVNVNIFGRRDDSLPPLPPVEHDVFSSPTPALPSINGNTADADEPLDWDSAQAVVERMVGMNQTNTGSEQQFVNRGQSEPHPHPQPHSHTPSPAPPGPPLDSRRRRLT